MTNNITNVSEYACDLISKNYSRFYQHFGANHPDQDDWFDALTREEKLTASGFIMKSANDSDVTDYTADIDMSRALASYLVSYDCEPEGFAEHTDKKSDFINVTKDAVLRITKEKINNIFHSVYLHFEFWKEEEYEII